MQKRLIIILSIGLGASLLVIAFLAGRMTAPAPIVVDREVGPAPEPPSVVSEQSSTAEEELPTPPKPEALVHEPLPLLRAPAVPPAQVVQSSASSQPSAIRTYFAKMDAIQSAGSGDPTIFAQGIVGGLQAGDTSGLDSLVTNARNALAQASAVQPPPACAEYHRRLLESLSESVAGVEKMRSALKKGDVSDFASLSMQFQSTQQKVDDLDRIKRQLLSQ